MRQLICRRTCEWLEIGYTYRAVRISYLVRLAEVAHIHIGYCKITTCYRARPDKRAQRCSVSSYRYIYICCACTCGRYSVTLSVRCFHLLSSMCRTSEIDRRCVHLRGSDRCEISYAATLTRSTFRFEDPIQSFSQIADHVNLFA